MILSGIVHLVLNRRTILDSHKSDDGEIEALNRPLLAALGLTLFVFVGTLLGLPPMAQVLDLAVHIKDGLSETYGEPPYGHAELTPLDEFCRRFGIDLERAKAALVMKNIRVLSTGQTLKDIADDNGLAPGGVYEALKHAWEASRTVTVPSTSAPTLIQQPSRSQASVILPKDPPPGLGKRRLSDICEEYGLDLARMAEKLHAGGIEAPAAMTLKEIADKNGMLPIDVYEAMRAEAPVKRPAAVAAPHAPAQTPAQAPAQTPAQTPVQVPAQPPAQAATQTPGQSPAQVPAQAPAQTPAQAPAQAQVPAQPQVPAQTQVPAQVPPPPPPADRRRARSRPRPKPRPPCPDSRRPTPRPRPRGRSPPRSRDSFPANSPATRPFPGPRPRNMAARARTARVAGLRRPRGPAPGHGKDHAVHLLPGVRHPLDHGHRPPGGEKHHRLRGHDLSGTGPGKQHDPRRGHAAHPHPMKQRTRARTARTWT